VGASDPKRGVRETLAFVAILHERRPIEREPAMLHRLVEAVDQCLGSREPSHRSRRVSVDGTVEEGEPARLLRCLERHAPMPKRRKRPLARVDGRVELP